MPRGPAAGCSVDRVLSLSELSLSAVSIGALSMSALSIIVADSAPATRLVIRTRATEAIAASASPRNPSVPTDSSSLSEAILLVAWRVRARVS